MTAQTMGCRLQVILNQVQTLKKKFRIRETLTLLTGADSSTVTMKSYIFTLFSLHFWAIFTPFITFIFLFF